MSKKCACSVCFEELVGRACRRCNNHVCLSCLEKWMGQCYRNGKNPDCPLCRTVWKPPNFFIRAPGTYMNTYITIYCEAPAERCYSIFPVHAETVVGFVVLDPELFHEPFSLHVDDIEKLEPYAADIKWLFQDLQDNVAVFSSEMPVPHVLGQFEKAGLKATPILETDDVVYFTKDLADFIKVAQTLEIGFF